MGDDDLEAKIGAFVGSSTAQKSEKKILTKEEEEAKKKARADDMKKKFGLTAIIPKKKPANPAPKPATNAIPDIKDSIAQASQQNKLSVD